MIRLALAALALAVAAPALAQAPAPPVQAPAPDPARLAAARGLMGTLMPPALRDRMVDDMMRPMMANMGEAMMQSPQMKTLLANDPRVQAVFSRFMQAQFERATRTMRNGMPAMMEAMSRAYARRFTLAQMDEIGAFFTTPTGKLYVEQAPTIMADPDVAAWMQQYMTDAMADMPKQVDAMKRELTALEKDKR